MRYLKYSNSWTETRVAVRSRRQPGRKNEELLFDGVSVWEDEFKKWLLDNVNILNALKCTF